VVNGTSSRTLSVTFLGKIRDLRFNSEMPLQNAIVLGLSCPLRARNLRGKLLGEANTVKVERRNEQYLDGAQRAVESTTFSAGAGWLWAHCHETHTDSGWPFADHTGFDSGQGFAVDWTWLRTVCGRGEDTAVDCPRP